MITIRKGHLAFVTEANDCFGDDGDDDAGGDGDDDDMRFAEQIECGRLKEAFAQIK